MEIVFINEFLTKEKIVRNENEIEEWIKNVAEEEEKSLGKIVYNFVSEEKILQINRDFLNHNYKTDIITFDYSFLNEISGEIYICLPVVYKNSKIFSKKNKQHELNRVIIHGILHLCGYTDNNSSNKKKMRNAEDYYLKYLLKG